MSLVLPGVDRDHDVGVGRVRPHDPRPAVQMIGRDPLEHIEVGDEHHQVGPEFRDPVLRAGGLRCVGVRIAHRCVAHEHVREADLLVGGCGLSDLGIEEVHPGVGDAPRVCARRVGVVG